MAWLCTKMGISDTFLLNLKLSKISTITDYIHEDTEKISDLCKASFKEVLEVRRSLIANFSAIPKSGISSYLNLFSSSVLIPSGIKQLDELLGGGIMTGTILEFCGTSGDGKTQLCLTIASNIAMSLKQAVHYIDTKNDFSTRRILTILNGKTILEQDSKKALEKIQVIKIRNIYQLISHLNLLRKSLNDEDIILPRVVILDAVPPLYLPFIGSKTNQGFGLLNYVMTTMKSLATEFHLLFIVVNLTSSYIDTESSLTDKQEEEEVVTDVRPMLGKYWQHTPHTRLLISKLNNEDSHHSIQVLKSSNLPSGKTCMVKVSQSGVV